VAYYYEDIWTRNFLTPAATATEIPVITTESVGHGYPIASFSVEDSLIGEVFQHADYQDKSYSQPIWGGVLGWCAFDYNSGHPNAVTLTGGRYVSPHGQADIFRIPKFGGYFFGSQKDATLYGPMIRILNYWKSNSPASYVYVASNCDQVELFVNGASKGKITPASYSHLPSPLATFSVGSFTSGNLKADGYIGGVLKVSETWYTPGAATKLVLTPDDATLNPGGDMTRVVVMAEDANNQYVPYNSTSVTLSASGAGDFLGESPIALEDGKTCFYVKTRASTAGTITCSASATGLTGASATINVVAGTTSNQPQATVASRIEMQKTMYRTVLNNRLIMPEWAKKGSQISAYNMSGKLIYRNTVNAKFLDLGKLGTGKGIYLVKIAGDIQKD
jgi:beta-galactosidase